MVAVGTIADMVPLNSDNRVFAVHGLRRLNQDTRPGLAALKAVAGIAAKNIDARAVAFHWHLDLTQLEDWATPKQL